MVAVSALSEAAENKEVGRAMGVIRPEDFVELETEEDYGAGEQNNFMLCGSYY